MRYSIYTRLFFFSFFVFSAALRASLTVPKEEAAPQNFLFKHFGLSGAFRTIPKGVQHIIVSKLRELIVGSFELEKAFKKAKGLPDHVFLSVFFSPDDSFIAYAHRSRICIRNFKTEDVAFFRGRDIDSSGSLGFSGDATRLIFYRQTEIVSLELDKGYRIVKEILHRPSLAKHVLPDDDLPLEFDPNADSLVGRLLALENLSRLKEQGNEIKLVGILNDGSVVMVTRFREIFQLVRGEDTFEPIGTLQCSHACDLAREKTYCVIHPLTLKIYFLSESCGVEVFDVKTRQSAEVLDAVCVGQFSHVQPMTVSRDGKYLALKNLVGDEEGLAYRWLSIWDLETRECIWRMFLDHEKYLPFTFSPNGKFMLFNTVQGARLYHLESRQSVACTTQNATLENQVAFNNSGTHFTVLSDNILTLWVFNPLWNDLSKLYNGQITLEQALFILLLREVKAKKNSLRTGLVKMCHGTAFSSDEVYSYLTKQVYLSFDKALRRYILQLMVRE